MAHPVEGKAHQQRGREPARLERGKAQEQWEIRRVKEKEATRPVQGEAQQQWKRTSVEKLRIRAEVYCGKGVLEEVQLLELGWMTKEVVVSYLVCKRCGERGCHVGDNRGQGVICSKRQEVLNWCGCKGKAAHGQENRKAQQKRRVVKRRSGEPSKC